MTSVLLDRPGAVAGTGSDAGVAWHYGDPFREQRQLIEDGGVVDRSHRGVLRVSGPDRLSWLHATTSQHLDTMPPEEVREALVLSPHGHVEHHLVLRDDGESTWIHVEPGDGDGVTSYLESMRFMLRVEVVDETASYAVLSVRHDGGWEDRIVPRGELEQRVDAVQLPLVGYGAYEALRVEAHRPRLGFETDHRTIPHEVGWIGTAVHLNKGCYRGQETVARVHNLGRPPRRLVFLHLDGSVEELPGHGAPVEWQGRQVGFITSSARHYELGPIALALVKRSVPMTEPLLAGPVAAAQEEAAAS